MNFPVAVQGDSVGVLRRDTVTAFNRVTSVGEAKVVKDVAIAATQTAVAHGLSATPRACFVMGQVAGTVHRSAVPDSRYVYLTGSIAITCDILIIP